MHINGDQPLLNISDLHDLDLGSGHTAYCRVSLIDLCPNTKFRSNQKKFLWTIGSTYVQTRRRTLRPASLGRLLEQLHLITEI